LEINRDCYLGLGRLAFFRAASRLAPMDEFAHDCRRPTLWICIMEYFRRKFDSPSFELDSSFILDYSTGTLLAQRDDRLFGAQICNHSIEFQRTLLHAELADLGFSRS